VTKAASGLPVSVQTRLNTHARIIGADPNFVLTRYVAERFLYRLSRSIYAERFVLKGALLMLAWLGETLRPTRDVDFLGYGDLSADALSEALTTICTTPVEPDGLVFEVDSLRIEPIREVDAYGGWRAALRATLGNARIPLQIDVGIGDAAIPAPEWLTYPALLEFPAARVRAYRPETSIAEKVHAMVLLGDANSRMRDFFDIHALAMNRRFEILPLVQAIEGTFARRDTPVPSFPPIALTRAFAVAPAKEEQWQGFLRRSGLDTAPANFSEVVDRLAHFLQPVIEAASRRHTARLAWLPGGPWRAMKDSDET